MEFVVVALLVALVVYVLGKRLGAGDSAGASLFEASEGGTEEGGFESPPLDIYDISAHLADFFNVTAHPKDLLNSAVFEQGVRTLCKRTCTVETLVSYATGDNAIISCLAMEALRRRQDGGEAHGAVCGCIGTIGPWPQYFGLKFLAEKTPPEEPIIGPVLAVTVNYLEQRLSRSFLAEFVQDRIQAGEEPSFEKVSVDLNENALRAIRGFLADLEPGSRDRLTGCLDRWQSARVDERLLRSVGSLWDEKETEKAEVLVDHPALNDALNQLEAGLVADRPQPSLVVGERGVGKTAILRKLAQRLHGRGWTVFVCGHADLIAGQIYVGQLEDRLKAIIEQLRGQRRVVWFVPSFHAMAYAGRHLHNPISTLDIILPLVEHGDLRIVGETTPAALNKVLQQQPRVATAFASLRVEPLTPQATLDLAKQWLARSAECEGEELLAQAWDLAQQYLGDRAAPGNLLGLLEMTLHRLQATSDCAKPTLRLDDVLVTLAGQTGLPLEILDHRRGLDVEGLRGLLSQRVIGQEEAVDCLVDRIVMMKAGLTETTRPIGVFLFAGPTGTGKTEIAKTLAEWLFGDAKALTRLDMSELQTPESLGRLIGQADGDRGDSLADQIRKRPFSVVLLDEFEKAHPKVWDTFLQVFDDARITDARGQIADFQHAVIILTSNLGAEIPTGAPMGFGSRAHGFNPRGVQAAIDSAFRREFINRLDRVVIFRPLSRETMRKILQKELVSAFQRRGLRNRAWAVEWDEAAIDFLLEKGFTRDLGARPLKRAIEQYLLSPLAMTIVTHDAPEGDQFLFVSCKENRLEVTFVDPDALPGETSHSDEMEAAVVAGEELSAQSILLQPRGTAEELTVLRQHLEKLELAVAAKSWQARKEDAFREMGSPDFWSSSARFATLSLAEYLDRVNAGVQRARSLLGRLEGRSGGRRGKPPLHLVGLLAQNLFLLETAYRDVAEGRPREAFLAIEVRQDGTQDWDRSVDFARRVTGMYESWADARRMRLTQLEDLDGTSKPVFRRVYAVSGYGAYSLLAPERGLHVLEWPGAKPRQFERASVHVWVAPHGDGPPAANLKELLYEARQALHQDDAADLTVVRRYREKPSPLVRDAVRGWRSGRLDLVLAGNFDAL